MSSDNSAEMINKEIYRATIEPLLDAPIDSTQIRLIEEYLEKIEAVIEQLKSDKINTTEAIRQLRNISQKSSG